MGGPGWLGGEPREALGGWARAPEGGRSLGGGGGLLPARGTTGAPLERGGGGRACIAPCRAMSIHGRAAWGYIPNPPRRSPFLGGLRGGGGGAGGCRVYPPMRGGGSPVGAPSGLAEKTRWRPLGSWAPSRKNLGFAGGDSVLLPPGCPGLPSGCPGLPPGGPGLPPGCPGLPSRSPIASPGGSGATPGTSGGSPGESGATPGVSGASPGMSGGSPRESRVSPGESGATPGVSGATFA